jgi:hypothetical protein
MVDWDEVQVAGEVLHYVVFIAYDKCRDNGNCKDYGVGQVLLPDRFTSVNYELNAVWKSKGLCCSI